MDDEQRCSDVGTNPGADACRIYGDNDRINGGIGADQMWGGIGSDVFYVDHPGDRVYRASLQGVDTVYASVSYVLTANQVVELLSTTANGGLASINLTGSSIGQRIVGNNGSNILRRLGGNDSIVGGTGNDVLSGGTGNDMLAGGYGADAFLFDAPLGSPLNADRILDYNVPQDTIWLDNAVMPGLGARVGAGSRLRRRCAGPSGRVRGHSS